MAKNDPKRGLDEQPLEGGGGGGGYKSAPKKSYDPDSEAMGTIAKGLGIPLGVAGVGVAADRLSKNKTPYDDLPKKDAMTPGQKQSMQEAKDAKMQAKKDKAYNAAKTYPDDFAKGGKVSSASARADGIAQRGKTRGTIVMCGGGAYKK